jgi:hypothetical protein
VAAYGRGLLLVRCGLRHLDVLGEPGGVDVALARHDEVRLRAPARPCGCVRACHSARACVCACDGVCVSAVCVRPAVCVCVCLCVCVCPC